MSRNMRLFQPALASGSTAEAVAADEPPNPVLDWLALYLPSWGTSVVLHAALIVLATFVAWRTYEETRLPPPWGVALKTDRYRLEQRPQGPAEVRKDRSRLALKKEPYAFSPTKLPQPQPGIGHADTPADIPVIGISGGPRGGENLWGHDGPGGPGDGTIFEPVPDARRIVYVVDRSGSMTDSLEWYVKPELKRSIGELTGEHAFHVIFYSSGPPVEMPTRRLVEATDRNRRLAFEFIDAVVARDQTDPSEALRRAFEVRPEVIYFLTDGEFDRAIVGLVKQLNAAGHVRVNTIAFLYDGNKEVLERIAADNGGRFKFVSERDLAALGR